MAAEGHPLSFDAKRPDGPEHAAPVNNLDSAFPELPVQEREMIVEYEHPQVGNVQLPENPVKMSTVMGTTCRTAPMLGEHTDGILKTLLHLSPEQFVALRKSAALGASDPTKNSDSMNQGV